MFYLWELNWACRVFSSWDKWGSSKGTLKRKPNFIEEITLTLSNRNNLEIRMHLIEPYYVKYEKCYTFGFRIF